MPYNPYLEPLVNYFIKGHQGAQAYDQFNRNLAEGQRQFNTAQPYRNEQMQAAQLLNAQRKAAQDVYMWAAGGNGQMFDQPFTQEAAIRMLANPFISSYLGASMPNMPAPPKPQLITTIEGGRPVQKYVTPQEGQTYPVYREPKEPREPKEAPETWGPVQYDPKLGFAYQTSSRGQVRHLANQPSPGTGGRGEYTPQQLVDDNRSYYNELLKNRTAAMRDPVMGIVRPEFRDSYNQIYKEIETKALEDYKRIQNGQRPSWLTGDALEAGKDQEFLNAINNLLKQANEQKK